MSPSTESRENRELAGEVKFIVPQQLGLEVRAWARRHLSPDPNAGGAESDQYRITSIYFDTPGFDVYQRKKSYGRSKLRIRRYGTNSDVFLERKLKTRGLVTKRRMLVSAVELDRLASELADKNWRGRWFHRRLLLRRLHPVCQITYDRTARVTMTEHGPIRLTIDENLGAIPLEKLAFEDTPHNPILPGQLIIEIKFRAQLPAIFKSLLQDFTLTPLAVSKYRLSVARLGLAPLGVAEEPKLQASA